VDVVEQEIKFSDSAVYNIETKDYLTSHESCINQQDML